MTRKEIISSYGIRMFWKLGIDDVELSEQEEKEAHEFARLLSEHFQEIYEDADGSTEDI